MTKPTLKLMLLIATFCAPALGHAQEVPDEADPMDMPSYEVQRHNQQPETHRPGAFTVTQEPDGSFSGHAWGNQREHFTTTPPTDQGSFVVNQWGPQRGFRTCTMNQITHQLMCN